VQATYPDNETAAAPAAAGVSPPPAAGPRPPPGWAAGREAGVASAGLALAAVLLAAVAGVAGWAMAAQSAEATAGQADHVAVVAAALAAGVEPLLAQDDLSGVRRLVNDAAAAHGLAGCRVVLPSGRVVAAANAAERVTVVTLPDKWTEKAALTEAATPPGTVAHTQSLVVPDRGLAFLQLSAAVPDGGARRLAAMAVVGGVGSVLAAGLLLVYRRARGNGKAAAAVRDALLAAFPPAGASAGATTSAAVAVDPRLGPEAVAWNALVAERDYGRKDALAERAREALGRRRKGRGDLDAACDAMSQGLILIDDQMRVKYANGAAAALLRVDRDKLVGGDVTALVRADAVTAAVREVVSGTSRRRAVVDVERTDNAPPAGRPGGGSSGPGGGGGGGAVGLLRFTIRPVRREDVASAMIIVEDITQQRAAEEARHAFVAQVTHELRTPLTNIRLYVETAIEDGEADPAVRTQALNVINGEARRLERIVGEMLSVAEIEAGQFKLRVDDVRLDALFEELRNDYQEQAKEKRHTLTFLLPPKLPVLVGDRDKVAGALHNLVGNALKYTPDGGSVTVRVEADDKRLAVAVADTGIGIAPDDQERVFERFYRANDKRVAKITGTGLGLPIAREAARLHGGDVTCESQLDHGSTFTLTLPLKPAA
jgi:signal transduction histidine kinase